MATTADDVWRLLGELTQAQKQTQRLLDEMATARQQDEQELTELRQKNQQELTELRQKNERELTELRQKTETLRQQNEELRRQNEQEFAESRREADRRLRETDRQMKEQNKALNQQLGKLGNRLGEFVEWQVRPAVVKLFQERGIAVHEFYADASARRGGDALEIDLLVVNTTQAVLVEVKSKLTQADVNDHLERLTKFKRLMPRYGDVQAMGAVAAMVVPDDAARYAYRQGFFVLAPAGEDMVILNDAQFQPRIW